MNRTSWIAHCRRCVCLRRFDSSHPPLERRHFVSIATVRSSEIRAGLAHVVVPQPPLDRREGHAGVHPSRAGFAPEIVEVQTPDVGPLAQQPPSGLDGVPSAPDFVAEDECIRRQNSPAGSSAVVPKQCAAHWKSEYVDPSSLSFSGRAGEFLHAAKIAPDATGARAARPAGSRSPTPPRCGREGRSLRGVVVPLRRLASAASRNAPVFTCQSCVNG